MALFSCSLRLRGTPPLHGCYMDKGHLEDAGEWQVIFRAQSWKNNSTQKVNIPLMHIHWIKLTWQHLVDNPSTQNYLFKLLYKNLTLLHHSSISKLTLQPIHPVAYPIHPALKYQWRASCWDTSRQPHRFQWSIHTPQGHLQEEGGQFFFSKSD